MFGRPIPVMSELSFPLDLQMIQWHTESTFSKDIIRGFGNTVQGNSVCLTIHNAKCWFYVGPGGSSGGTDISELYQLLSDMSEKIQGFEFEILTDKYDFYGYHPETCKVIKVTCDSSGIKGTIVKRLKKHVGCIPVYDKFERPEGMSETRADELEYEHDQRNLEINFSYSKHFKLFETRVSVVQRLFHSNNLKPSGIITVKKGEIEPFSDTSCQIEIVIRNPKDIINHHDKGATARFPILQMSFDIEVYSHHANFPSPTVPENVITHIAMTFKWSTTDALDPDFTICLSNGACNVLSKPGLVHEVFSTEQDLLAAFSRHVINVDPDIIMGFNTDIFDFNYICTRAGTDFRLGRLPLPDKLRDASFKSSAYGLKKFKRLSINGRVNHDLYISVSRDYKLSNYKLDSICKDFLKDEKKDEMLVSSMFSSYRESDPVLSAKVAAYCIQDTRLVQLLYDKMKYLNKFIAMSCTVNVTYDSLFISGEQNKVSSLIIREAGLNNYIVPDVKYCKTDYEGATVLPPIPGIYRKPIITLDFASLYPSIIIANNLCYSTFILPGGSGNSDGPGVPVKSFQWTDAKCIYHNYNYVDTSVRKGLSGTILAKVWESRKATKRLMKSVDPNSFQYTLLDMQQLSYKLVMNSYYGFFASQSLCLQEIAATVTFIGRSMIAQVTRQVEKDYPKATCIYGDTDSVFIDIGLDLEAALKIGPVIANDITTKLFTKPVELEFEKVYMPLIMLKKKRYMGVLWTRPEKFDKIDSKGVILQRRDNFPLVRDVYQKVRDILLFDTTDPSGTAISFVKDTLDKLFKNKIDIKKLVKTTSFKGIDSYKNPDSQLSCILAKKIKNRDPASEPKHGDRISYVYVKLPKSQRNVAKSQVVEDATYAATNNIRLDTSIYIEEMQTPLSELLVACIANPETLFFKYKAIEFKKRHPELDPQQQKLTDFLKTKTSQK